MRFVHILEENQTPRRRAAQVPSEEDSKPSLQEHATRGVAVHAKVGTEAGIRGGTQKLKGSGMRLQEVEV